MRVARCRLVIVPTAASVPDAEPSKPFLWKIRVQSHAEPGGHRHVQPGRQRKGDVTFAGQSVVVDPYGNVVSKADDQEHS